MAFFAFFPRFAVFFAFVFFLPFGALFFVAFFAFFLARFGADAAVSPAIGSIGIEGSGAMGVGGGKSGSIIPGPLQPLSMGVFS